MRALVMKMSKYVMSRLAALIYVWLFSGVSVAAADTIFSDDFQDGSYSDWTLSGDGYDAANYYYGNYSMRLDGLRQGVRSLSSSGYTSVSLTMDLAALYLVTGDYCYAEYSTDGGSSWNVLRQLGNGADDGYFRTTTISTGLNDNPNLKVRFRAYTLYGNYCYGDNVLLTGTPDSGGAPEITVSGSGAFGNVTVGTSSTKTITVSNDGDANLDVGSLSGLAAPFSLSGDNCSNISVAPGNSCSVMVQFSPTAETSYSDILNIPSNDSDEATSTVAMSGSGGSCDYDCLGGNGDVSRSAATYSQLTNPDTVGLVNYSHYAVPGNAADPSNTFEGTLTLTIVDGTLTEQGTSLAGSYGNPDRLPDFSYDFVQHGTHIIPVERGVLPSSGSDWEYILAPGRVWDENGDNGYSRVALPFALTERNANCVHNGVMTFLFDDSGAVSQVAYQIAQETCLYFKYNLHGELNASYSPSSVSGAASLKSAYETEVNNRMPTKPISELASDYPNNGVTTSNIGSEVTASHMTLFGVAYNGVHYTGGCGTRQGTYPYCDVMAVPSYSTAKSVVGGLGLMRLEQLYSGSRDLIVGDYVSECTGFQWDDVTLENALDMATGNYSSSGFMTDEGSSSVENNFFLKETHADKVSHSCGYSRMTTPNTTPNTTFVYHTSDTYLLGRATNVYYKGLAGSTKDVYNDLLVNDIWKPLGMSPITHKSKRTYDSAAQFWAGFGLIYHSDDVVKLAEFLNEDNGKIGETQMLDTGLLNSALQKNSGDRGLNAGSSNDKYQNGFWAYNLNASSVMSACTTDTWVPYMSGYGGISVILLPSGMVYYFFSDNDEHGWTTTAKELDKISSICN
jgi:hypothetical protein